MAQHSDDAPKQPRRSGVLPPFVAPRTPQGTSSTRDRDTDQRRSPHPAAAPPAIARTQNSAPSIRDTSAAEPASPASSQRESVAVAGSVPQAGDRELVVESLEPDPITLRITGEQPAVDGAPIQVFEHGESESALHTHTTEQAPASEERLELEPTEFSLDISSAGKDLQVESFWAAEPFASVHGEPPAGSGIADQVAAREPSREEPLHGDLADSSAPAVDQASDAPDVAAFVAAAFAPDLDRSPERELDARLEPTSVERGGPEGELARGELDVGSPHAATAPSETPHAIEWNSPWGEATKGAAEQVTDAPAGTPGEVEPWALPPSEPAEVNPQESIAAALERVAHRVRAGEIVLAPGGPPTTDEAALAAVLAALLRVSRG